MSAYAIINAGHVDNVIDLNPDLVELFSVLGELIDVTDLSPRPGPGWTYDGRTFTAPPPPAPEPAPEPEPAPS